MILMPLSALKLGLVPLRLTPIAQRLRYTEAGSYLPQLLAPGIGKLLHRLSPAALRLRCSMVGNGPTQLSILRHSLVHRDMQDLNVLSLIDTAVQLRHTKADDLPIPLSVLQQDLVHTMMTSSQPRCRRRAPD